MWHHGHSLCEANTALARVVVLGKLFGRTKHVRASSLIDYRTRIYWHLVYEAFRTWVLMSKA